MLKASVVRSIPLYHAAALRGASAPCLLGATRRTFMKSHVRLDGLASKQVHQATLNEGASKCEFYFLVLPIFLV